MRKVLSVLLVVCLLLVLLSACEASKGICLFCGSSVSDSAFTYCPYCGERLLGSQNNLNNSADITPSDAERIVGTWQHFDPSWGLMEYTFYSDGFCKGTYIGELNSYGGYQKTGGVNPAIYPDAYYEGSGDGYWYFSDNMLRIEYIGEEQGTMYHTYYFSADGTTLTIEGKGTYTAPSSVTWEKVD